jgi:hypothetical protein
MKEDAAYQKEKEILNHYSQLSQSSELGVTELKNAIKELTDHYEKLLDEVKLLTNVGDKLQRKLRAANIKLKEQQQQIRQINADLERRNKELEATIHELIRTRAGRKATTIVLVLALILFIISELFENYIDSAATSLNPKWGNYISWGIKIGLAVLFKPIESLLEKFFVERAILSEHAQKVLAETVRKEKD